MFTYPLRKHTKICSIKFQMNMFFYILVNILIYSSGSVEVLATLSFSQQIFQAMLSVCSLLEVWNTKTEKLQHSIYKIQLPRSSTDVIFSLMLILPKGHSFRLVKYFWWNKMVKIWIETVPYLVFANIKGEKIMFSFQSPFCTMQSYLPPRGTLNIHRCVSFH